ncbi:MAG: YfbM family protein [Planctomycetes bacterium]|nr:YfbM family protein [Planctomycetota bacterium]
MGIITIVRAITEAELEALHADPDSIHEFLEGDDWVREVVTPKRPWWQFWRKPQTLPFTISARFESPRDEDVVDLDKAWHGLHWLLTGSSEPLGDLRSVLADEAGDVCRLVGGHAHEVGYGPARTLDVTATREFAKILHALDHATCRQRYDPERMEADEVYPEGIWRAEGEGALEFVLDARDRLDALLQRASASGRCLVIWAT